jgi:hypothetical protein
VPEPTRSNYGDRVYRSPPSRVSAREKIMLFFIRCTARLLLSNVGMIHGAENITTVEAVVEGGMVRNYDGYRE